MDKEQRKKLLIEMMQEDEKNGMYEKTDNELIAEFMGVSFDRSGQCTDPEQKYSWRPGCYDPLRIEHLQYDTSWNWLMPVVHKILKTIMPPPGEGWPYVYIQLEGTRVGNSIEYVYQRVVEFIKWYNQQTK